MTRPGEDNRRLATQLRTLRELNNISGRELAQRIGLSQSKLSRIECGVALPSIAELTAWAAAVGAPQQTEHLLQALTDAVRIEAEHRLCLRNLSETLDIGMMQLRHREQRIHDIGVDLDDLALVTDYLRALAEHGKQVAHLAQSTFADAPRSHPLRSTEAARDIEVYLSHLQNLFEAAQTFASDALARIRDTPAT